MSVSVRRLTRALVALGATAALVAAGGCGSSKPGYCSDLDSLQSSIGDLKSLSLSDGFSGLQSQLKTIQSDARTLVDSARSDFPSETSAITSSVDSLASAVRTLPSSPSPSQVGAIATDATNVVSSVRRFTDATDSKCS
jgi:hypothetical protein